MTTIVKTKDSVIGKRAHELILGYLRESAGLTEYLDWDVMEYVIGRYRPRGRLIEMLTDKQHQKYGEVTVSVYNNTFDVYCSSESYFFTNVCLGIEKMLFEKMNIIFNVYISTEYIHRDPKVL